MIKKIRNDYHQASQWAHHHSAVLVLWLTMIAAAFGWQFGGNFIDSQAHASYDPTPWIGRCDANSGNYVVGTGECYALANIYAQLDGPDWDITVQPGEEVWFSGTDLDSWHGIDLVDNHVDRLSIMWTSGLGGWSTPSFGGLPYLTHLRFWNSNVSLIDISANTALERLDIRYHPNMTSLDVSNNTNLTYLDVEGNELNTIDLTSLPNLVEAYLSYNNIASVDLSNNPLLERLNLASYDWAYLTSLDVSNNSAIKHLYLNWQGLTSLDISNLVSLESLSLAWNYWLSTLSLPNTTTLGYIDIQYTDVQSIDVSPYTNLYWFRANNSSLNSITFGDNSLLSEIYLEDNALTSIDLSTIANKSTLTSLYLQNNFLTDLWTWFHQFTNIWLMDWFYTHDDKLNGNCLVNINEPLLSFLNSTYENWEGNQTCGRDVPESEYNALVALYNATDGDNWWDNNGWLQDTSVCDWYGVTCEFMGDSDHVTRLDLWNNNLIGSIPDLSDLVALRSLFLDSRNDNDFDNTIDLDLSMLSWIETLEEVGARWALWVTGSLNELLASSGTLTYLQLWSPMEPWVFDIDELSAFTNLSKVYLENHILEWNLDTLGWLPSLTEVNLSCYDTIDYCAVTGTLNFVANTPNIVQIDLQSLGIAWPLPAAINNLASLEILNLEENNLTGPLPSLDAATNMIEILLRMNNFSWTIPASWSSLSSLQKIALWWNSLNDREIVGSLPADWSSLTNLDSIQISFTKITWELPEEWSALTNLTDLQIFFNNITGPIPDSRSVFAGVPFDKFRLNNNHLEGTIPSWIENMTQNFKIDSNCLNTNGLSPEMIAVLDEFNWTWESQNNCLSNVQVTKVLSNEMPVPGEDFTLTISYHNIWSQKAPRFQVNEVIDEDIQLMTSVPPWTLTTVNKSLWISWDACYDDFLVNDTGPYYDYMAQVLAWFIGGGEDPLPENATSQEIYDLAWMGLIGPETALQDVRDYYLGGANASTGSAIVTLLCAFVNGSDVTPDSMVDLYQNMGTDCLPAFGLDYRDYESQCGFGGEEWYRREVGDLVPDASGSIVLNLRLVPDLTIGSEHDATTYLVLDGENLGSNIIPTPVIVWGSNGGWNNGGGNGWGESNTTPSGGWGTTLEVDDCTNYTPPEDASSSYYDAKCEEEIDATPEHKAPEVKKDILLDDPIAFTKKVQEVMQNMEGSYSTELVQWYVFARDIWITTIDSIDDAMIFNNLRRDEAAKMISTYAMEILGMEPNLDRECNFVDMKSSSQEMQWFAKLACQLGIMGLLPDGETPDKVFNPSTLVDRSQWGTMMSRMIYAWSVKWDDTCRYCAHLEQLKKDKIMNKIDVPTEQEVRWYVMLMMMRAYSTSKDK